MSPTRVKYCDVECVITALCFSIIYARQSPNFEILTGKRACKFVHQDSSVNFKIVNGANKCHFRCMAYHWYRVVVEAVSCDLSRGLPTGIFDNVRFIFVQYVRIVLQCKPDVKLSCVILCWINPCLSLSLSLAPLLTCINFNPTMGK